MEQIVYQENYMLSTLTINRPDDWHVHCRDQEMLSTVVRATAQHFSRALLMPNLKPPLTSVPAILDYRQRVMSALDGHGRFTPYMTLYINESVSPDELFLAKQTPYILGAKLYPAGATTHSEMGVKSIQRSDIW
jgi:dihydroorotase